MGDTGDHPALGATDDETPGTAGTAFRQPPTHAPVVSRFRASSVPSIGPLQKYYVTNEEEWPLFFLKIVEHYGITYGFVLMCANNARRFYTDAQLRDNDDQEAIWMRDNSACRELLEAHIYNDLLLALQAWTDVFEIFDDVTPAHSRCAGKLCNALLTAYPLDAERLQHKLFIRALKRSLKPDMASHARYTEHCRLVRDDMRAMPNLKLSVEQILAAIATSLCEGHSDPRVNDAYYKIQDAVDNGDHFTWTLVKARVTHELKKTRAGSRPSILDDAHALRSLADAPTNSKCKGCAGCSLHCVDRRSGNWRAAPSSSARARGAFLTAGDSCDEDTVERAALRRVERAAGEARAMVLARSFDSSHSGEGSSAEETFEALD